MLARGFGLFCYLYIDVYGQLKSIEKINLATCGLRDNKSRK